MYIYSKNTGISFLIFVYTKKKEERFTDRKWGVYEFISQKQKKKIICTGKEADIHDPILLKEIEKVKLEMDTAYSNFQNVMDPDLIDCYIYESNAAQKKYHFLLKQLKGVS